MIGSKVTIVMATYNRAHFILEALYSIQKQTYLNWECLIIDDGGSDNTLEVISSILETDSRFKFFKRPDIYKKGLPGCRNYALDLAKGDFIVFFDDDDIVHPDNLKICLEVLNNENLDFCHYQKLSFEKERPLFGNAVVTKKESFSKINIEKVIKQEIGFASCTVIWKSDCFHKNRFHENLLYAEEWECYSRLISEDFKGMIIDPVLYYNRKHEVSNTAKFYNNDPVYKASKKEAILLIIQNLKRKQLLTNSLLRYFITISVGYKEYNLFNQIMNVLDLSIIKKIKCYFFYQSYSLRLPIYKIKKRFK
jgi:GalNAc5-diNAcBac-PP-undecaprenol beta-1,3-glucosyltransferase